MYLPPAISCSLRSAAPSLAHYSDLPAPAAAAASASPLPPAAEGLSEDGLQREERRGQRCGNRVILLPLEQEGGRETEGEEGRASERASGA